MNDLKIWESQEFGVLRVIERDGEPWMVGKDVAQALGYGEGKSLANAVANHVDPEDKGLTELMTPGGKQKMVVINESGLYSLVLSSKLPGAKRFRRWVTGEVLPSIRKDGGYIKTAPGMNWNMPTQRSMDMGLFEVKETSITHSDGHISVNKTVKVTGKGQIYFVNKLVPKKGA